LIPADIVILATGSMMANYLASVEEESMSAVPTLVPMNFIGPALGGVLFIAIMSLMPHPARRSFNAIFAAGAVGAYIGSAFGVWELVYPILATPVVYLGLRSYRAIGIAWLMHAAWDLPHHLVGHPIWPYVRTSSLGCMVFDSVIAVWFLAGAPSIFTKRTTVPTDSENTPGTDEIAMTP
jgi:Family of unknown function (DUF6010)